MDRDEAIKRFVQGEEELPPSVAEEILHDALQEWCSLTVEEDLFTQLVWTLSMDDVAWATLQKAVKQQKEFYKKEMQHDSLEEN